MKRPLKAEEARLWAKVAKTVRPAVGRMTLEMEPAPEPPAKTPLIPPARRTAHAAAGAQPLNGQCQVGKVGSARPIQQKPDLHTIEPLRKHRLVRQRDEIEARLDLHGLDQDRARAALHDFLLRAHGRGARAVLVITGKGTLGDGVLRRRTPEWLTEPHVRPIIAGVSQAARHHGGEGALYIALKRRPT